MVVFFFKKRWGATIYERRLKRGIPTLEYAYAYLTTIVIFCTAEAYGRVARKVW